MIENLIANWLTKVNELGYQLPFCAVLLSEGYAILHVSRHGRGEHGVDVVARAPDGRLCAFQLKGPEDINLREWQKIRPQVEDLVQLTPRLPTVAPGEPHYPYLVTNGVLVGDAPENFRRYQDEWESKGYRRLELWDRQILIGMFVSAHGSYLPRPLTDFRSFVELYVADFLDRLPRQKFATFLEGLVAIDPEKAITQTEIKRSVESMVLLGGYIVEQYERAENYCSAAEGWTIIASVILHVAEREQLVENIYSASLALAWEGLQRNLAALEREATEAPHLIASRYILAEPSVLPVRVGVVIGWILVYALNMRRFGGGHRESDRVAALLKREIANYQVIGEVDWPIFLMLALYLGWREGSPAGDARLMNWVAILIRANRGKEAQGLPSPYWLPEDVVSLHTGLLPEYKRQYFAGRSYTLHPALDMLVRRLCRQSIASVWPWVSRLTWVNFLPTTHQDWFKWKVTSGNERMFHAPLPMSWSAWRTEATELKRDAVPTMLIRHPEWLLPIAMTYPHRVNREFTTLVDVVFTRSAELV